MGGRGRGRQASSLTQEQLQVLGCVGKDIPGVPTAPPPTFPPLLTKPVSLEVSNSLNYQILWKEDFGNFMRDSPYFLTPKMSKSNIQRYSDRYVSILENSKERQKPDIPWNLMPAELRSTVLKRKLKGKEQPKKYKRIETLEERLKRLEEKEKSESHVEEKGQNPTDSEGEDNENEQEIEEDDEMDEDNDYGNNYFDNGEAFNDEDDNLDDGPIY